MSRDEDTSLVHGDLSKAIIGAYYDVYNELGYGFLEKVYENALAHELRKRGHSVEQQFPIKVYYDQQLMGEYFVDLLIDDSIILELKAVDDLHPKHKAQIYNYLKANEFEVGLLLNFGPKPTFKRKILTNDQKHRPQQ